MQHQSLNLLSAHIHFIVSLDRLRHRSAYETYHAVKRAFVKIGTSCKKEAADTDWLLGHSTLSHPYPLGSLSILLANST